MEKNVPKVGAAIILIILAFMIMKIENQGGECPGIDAGDIVLPDIGSLEDDAITSLMGNRRSVRIYSGKALSQNHLSRLMFATQGISSEGGKRTVPSAGATYPLTAYAIIGDVEGMGQGSYVYEPDKHALRLIREGDLRDELAQAAMGQKFIGQARMSIVLCAEYERTTQVYGERGIRYVHMEAGHAGQNIYLMAESLGLGTVAVGAFNDEIVGEIIGCPQNQEVVYIFPVGAR